MHMMRQKIARSVLPLFAAAMANCTVTEEQLASENGKADSNTTGGDSFDKDLFENMAPPPSSPTEQNGSRDCADAPITAHVCKIQTQDGHRPQHQWAVTFRQDACSASRPITFTLEQEENSTFESFDNLPKIEGFTTSPTKEWGEPRYMKVENVVSTDGTVKARGPMVYANLEHYIIDPNRLPAHDYTTADFKPFYLMRTAPVCLWPNAKGCQERWATSKTGWTLFLDGTLPKTYVPLQQHLYQYLVSDVIFDARTNTEKDHKECIGP